MDDVARFEECLQSSKPFEALRRLALALAAEGNQPEMVLARFDEFRAMLRLSDRVKDEDVVMNVMDCIVGQCSESMNLFPTHDWKKAAL